LTTNKERWSEEVEKPMKGLIDLIGEYHESIDISIEAFF